MSVKKLITTSLVLTLLCSCATLENVKNKFFKSNKEDGQTEVRLVDAQGNYRPVEKHVPILNADLIERQKRNKEASVVSSNSDFSGNKIVEKDLEEEPVIEVTPQISDLSNQQSLAENNQDPVTEVPGSEARIAEGQPTNNFGDNFGPSEEPLVESESKDGKKKAEIKYNLAPAPKLADNNSREAPKVADSPKVFKAPQAKSTKGIFVQIGSYSVKSGADSTLRQGQSLAKGLIKEINNNGQVIYKVLLGPVKDESEANSLLKKAKNNGFKDAFISKIK